MLDIIGTIYNNDGVYDDDGNVITPPTTIDGYHVNSTHYIEEFADKLVEPTTPRRMFAGAKTYCYTFADQAEFEAFDLENLTMRDNPPQQISKVISTMQFKLLFTAQERVAIKQSTDPIVQDFYELVEDPRLGELDLHAPSTQEAIAYLVDQGIVTDADRFL